MCFSAGASYTSAALLTFIGFGCIKKVSHPKQLFLAFIPIIFALQQLMEGILWTSTNEIADFVQWAPLAKNIYLTIALFVWPVWIPLSLFAIESVPSRNWLLAAFLAAGCVYVALYGNELIIRHRWEGIDVKVISHSIQYDLPFNFGWFYTFFYTAVTVLPFLFSSWKYMWMIGVGIFIGLLIAHFFYLTTFLSVWCFFAAVASLGIYFVIKHNSLKAQSESPKQ
jgi:hypothetical protein